MIKQGRVQEGERHCFRMLLNLNMIKLLILNKKQFISFRMLLNLNMIKLTSIFSKVFVSFRMLLNLNMIKPPFLPTPFIFCFRMLLNLNLKTIKLWMIIALHRLSIKFSKSLENKGFIAICSPYSFIWFHTSLLFPWLLIRAKSRARKSHNKI